VSRTVADLADLAPPRRVVLAPHRHFVSAPRWLADWMIVMFKM
jgi:hypothetical protein